MSPLGTTEKYSLPHRTQKPFSVSIRPLQIDIEMEEIEALPFFIFVEIFVAKRFVLRIYCGKMLLFYRKSSMSVTTGSKEILSKPFSARKITSFEKSRFFAVNVPRT